MKKLLLSTALVVSATAAAQAQDASANFRTESDPMEIHASNFIGKRVYASEAQLDADAYDGLQSEWEDIGEINDVVLSRSGEVEAVLVDIGGFLGIGERQVAVDMGAIKFVADDATAEDESDFFLVMNANRAAFEEAPEYTWNDTMVDGEQTAEVDGDASVAMDEQTAEAQVEGDVQVDGEQTAEVEGDAAVAPAETDLTAQAQTDGTAMSTDGDAVATTEPFARDGYVDTAPEELTAELLTGAPVYDANDEWIGEVSEILLTDAGQVDSTVIDVGGFLGIGEKPVELKLGDLNILREDGGDDVRVYVSATKDQLEAMPTYE